MEPGSDPDIRIKKDAFAFDALFEQVSDAIMITDFNANFLEVNTSFCKMIGYSREELLKMNVTQMFGQDAHSARPIRFDLLQQGEQLINERTMRHKDGHSILVRANVKKLNDDQIIAIATDVSEQTLQRQLSKDQLRKEKELSDKVINSLPGIFYVISDAGKYLRWNRNMEIQTGYTADEIRNLPPNATVAPEDRSKLNSEITKVFETGFGSVEARMLAKDGRMIPYYLTGISIDYEGVPALLGTGIDISQQEMARQEARISEETRKLIMDSALDAIICADIENRITVWTPQAEKIFGWKEKEMLGKTLSETIIPMRYRERHAAGFSHYRKTGNGQILNRTIEVPALHQKGHEFPIELSIVPIKRESDEFFCAFVRDITVRKLAEEALQRSEANLQAIFDTTDTAYTLLDKKLNVVSLNQGAVVFAENELGFNNDNAETVQHLLQMDKLKNLNRLAPKVFKGEKVSYETGMTRPDGSIHWYQVRLFPVRKPNKEIYGMMVAISDINKAKRGESEILQMNEQLRQLSSHLQTIREEERSHISREIHDELGQQLTSLKMLMNRLKTSKDADPDSIHSKADDMIVLVDETIKTVRRIATELRPGILDDLGLEAAIEWLLREFGKSSGIQCRYKISDLKENYSTQVNTTVFRIVQECLTNVSRHANATMINAKLYDKDNTLVMKILDNGVGISEENVGKKRTLGLLGMQERAKMVGGTCTIQKLPKRGTLVQLKISV